MDKKIALVTGGMGGIGTAICQRLAAEGLIVIATYNRGGDHEAAVAWQREQQKLGYEIDTCYVDVCNFDSCAEMVKNLEEKYHSIDILINNAGITRDSSFSKMDISQWNEVMRTNLDSIFHVTRNVINGMITRGYGRIVNISSINAQKGQYGQTNYSAAKAGIHGFTKSIAQEVAKNGITVNTISPGYIETSMVMNIPETIRTKIIEQIPVKRLGKPDEIARVVAFLAAEDSGFITGSNIVINGGQYLL